MRRKFVECAANFFNYVGFFGYIIGFIREIVQNFAGSSNCAKNDWLRGYVRETV